MIWQIRTDFSLTSPFPWDSRFLIHFIGIWFISSLKWYVLKVFCNEFIYIQYTVRVSDRHCQFKPHCSIAVTAFQCSKFYVALELSYFISRRFLFNFIKIQIPILITLARKIKIPTLKLARSNRSFSGRLPVKIRSSLKKLRIDEKMANRLILTEIIQNILILNQSADYKKY